MHVQTSVDKDKTDKLIIEWANEEQNRYVFNNIDKCRDKSVDFIIAKSMKKCLYRHFSSKRRKTKGKA